MNRIFIVSFHDELLTSFKSDCISRDLGELPLLTIPGPASDQFPLLWRAGRGQAAARPRGEGDSYNLLGCLVVAPPSPQFSYQTILKLRTDHRSDPTFGHFESTDPGNRDWKEFYENAEMLGRDHCSLYSWNLDLDCCCVDIWEYQGSGWRGVARRPLAAQPLF